MEKSKDHLEAAVLSALTEAKIADSQAFAKAHGVTHPTLDGALKSLEVDGYIVLAKN